jgi:hypothetical protein
LIRYLHTSVEVWTKKKDSADLIEICCLGCVERNHLCAALQAQHRYQSPADFEG